MGDPEAMTLEEVRSALTGERRYEGPSSTVGGMVRVGHPAA